MAHEVHLSGLGFPEGPVLLPDGSVAFVDLLKQEIGRYRNGKMEVVATVAGSPNGMRLGPDGKLYVANNGGVSPVTLHRTKVMDPQISGRIQRVSLDGHVEDIITELPGDGPWRPNDLIFTSDGRIVFTDPQNWEQVTDWNARGKLPGYGGGRLFVATPGHPAKLLTNIYGFPNGLAFHPDSSLLVALSLKCCIVKLPWFGDSVGQPEVWCQFEDGTAPDGIVFEGDRLYVAASPGNCIAVVDLEGRHLRDIETGAGSDPTNVCFKEGTLWVTLGTAGQLISISL